MLHGKECGSAAKLLGGHSGLSLLSDPRLLAKIHFIFQNSHRLQHHIWRQAGTWRSRSTSFAWRRWGRRRGHEVVCPAVECVRPEFGLGNRHPGLFIHVSCELSDTAEHVELFHFFQHCLKCWQQPSIKIALHVIHHGRESLCFQIVDLANIADAFLNRWFACGLWTAKCVVHQAGYPPPNAALLSRCQLEPLHKRAALQPTHHSAECIGHLRKLLQKLPLRFERPFDRLGCRWRGFALWW